MALALTSSPRDIVLSVLGPRPASGVRKDGATRPEAASPAAFEASATAWRHDPGTGFLDIKFRHTGGPATTVF